MVFHYVYQNEKRRPVPAPAMPQSLAPTMPLGPARTLPTGSEPLGSWVYDDSSLSTITVHNGADADVLVKLVNVANGQKIQVRNAYISRGGVFKMERLPEGSYQMLCAYGEDWDAAQRSFTRKQSYSRAERFLDVRTTETVEDGPEGRKTNKSYGGYTVQLKAVVDGNLPTQPIDAGRFNSLY